MHPFFALRRFARGRVIRARVAPALAARPLLVALAGGATFAPLACQGPEPFDPSHLVPITDTGGHAGGTAGHATGGRPATGGDSATGGRATGAASTGGRATGGTGTGGRSTGGAATGGSATGGAGARATGGTGGNANTGGAGGAPAGTCPTQKATVQLNASMPAAGAAQETIKLLVLNAGNDDIPVAKLRVRYYFSFTGTAVANKLTYEIDYHTLPTGTSVTATVGVTSPPPAGATGADDFLELTFKGAAILSPLGQFVVEGRLHDPSYNGATFNQPMDYSYVASTKYTTAPKAVAYVDTCLAGGTPPQ